VINDPGQRVPIKAWIDGVELEDAARAQLVNVAKLPFIHKHVAVMPDVHWGMGATVGSVIATKGAVVPAAVGVDIGCGMIAQRTSLRAADLPDDLGPMRAAIEAAVPHGRTDNGQANDRGAWSELPRDVEDVAAGLKDGLEAVRATSGDRLASWWTNERAFRHLGTLGTGNHFIEVCLDEADAVWIMLHSGSRGIGNAIGTTFIERAKKLAERYFISLPDPDLAYFPEGTQDFNEYVAAVGWAQGFASANRATMMRAVLSAVEDSAGKPVFLDFADSAINCHHNYVERENHFGQNVLVTRKGAVRARVGDLGIIPGSMGVRSYIVRGKGNADSFSSCSHGAGRRMSRGQAKKTITMEAFNAAMGNVESRRDADVLDEAPQAYKDIDAVIAAESDLVEVVHTLKQVVCVKG